MGINNDVDETSIITNKDEFVDQDLDNESKPLINGGENKKKISFMNFKYKKDSILLFTIFTILILNSFMYSLFLPNVFINYVKYHFPELSGDQLESKASYYKSYADSIPNLFMFLLAPLCGLLSDKYGRKLFLFFGGFLLLLDIGSCYITILTHNIWPFYIFHSIGGAANVAAVAVLSYIADITDEEERPLLYTFNGIASGFGVVAGPAIFIGTNHTKYINLPLFICFGFTSFALLLIPLLKESLDIAKECNRIKSSEKASWNPFVSIKKVFKNPYVGLICVLFLSVSYTAQDVLSTYYYYCGLVFNWGATKNSLFMGGIGLFIIFWSSAVIPQLLKKYSQRRLISFGFLISFIAHIGYSFSFKSEYIFIFSGVLGGYVPNNIYLIQSTISSSTPAEVQGSVLAGVQAAGSVAGFLGALAANDIYGYFISNRSFIYYPGAVYFINAIIVFFTFCFSLLIWRLYKDPTKNIKSGKKDEESNSKLIN